MLAAAIAIQLVFPFKAVVTSWTDGIGIPIWELNHFCYRKRKSVGHRWKARRLTFLCLLMLFIFHKVPPIFAEALRIINGIASRVTCHSNSILPWECHPLHEVNLRKSGICWKIQFFNLILRPETTRVPRECSTLVAHRKAYIFISLPENSGNAIDA